MKNLRFVLFVVFFSTIFTFSCKKENEDVFSGCLLKTMSSGNQQREHTYNAKGQLMSHVTTFNGIKSSEYFYTYNSSGLEESITRKLYDQTTGALKQESLFTNEYSGKNRIKSFQTSKKPNGEIISEVYYAYTYDNNSNVTESIFYQKQSGSWVEKLRTTTIYTYSSTGKILTMKTGESLTTNTYNSEDKLVYAVILAPNWSNYLQKDEESKTEYRYENENVTNYKLFVKRAGVYLLIEERESINSYSGKQLISVLYKWTFYENGNDISPTPTDKSESTTTYTYECR